MGRCDYVLWFCVVIICTFTLLSQEYNTISESWCSNGKNPFSFWNLRTCPRVKYLNLDHESSMTS